MASDFISVIEPGDPNKREGGDNKGLPILPVRDTVLFPHAVLPLTVGRESSIQLINSLGEEKNIVVVAQRDARVDAPQPQDLHTFGTLATVHKVVKMPNQSLFVFTEGTERVRLGEFSSIEPFMVATVETVPEVPAPKNPAVEALQRNVVTQFQQIVTASPTLSDELQTIAMNIDEPGRLVSLPLLCRFLPPPTSRSCSRPRTWRRGWSASTSTSPKNSKSSSCATRSRPKCRIRYSSRSATTTCANSSRPSRRNSAKWTRARRTSKS
jgi:Lon protease-like protein